MSLFRKEALEHRSRALFGEVVLRGPIAAWVITLILVLVMTILIAGLFFVTVDNNGEPLRLLDWLLSRDAE